MRDISKTKVDFQVAPSPLGGSTSLCIWAALIGLKRLLIKKKKAWSWEGDDVGEYWGKLEGEVVLGGYDQNTL